MTTLREALREVVEAIESLHRCDNATQRGGMWRRLHEAEEHARAALAASPGDPAAPAPAPEGPTPEEPSEAELAEWDRLANESTPGPWRLTHVGGGRDAYVIRPAEAPTTVTHDEGMEWAALDGRPLAHADGVFIVAARSAVPKLISALRASRDGGSSDSTLIRLLKAQVADWKQAALIREESVGRPDMEGHVAYGRGLARAADLIEECIRDSHERKG